jgi:hypothetical protein
MIQTIYVRSRKQHQSSKGHCSLTGAVLLRHAFTCKMPCRSTHSSPNIFSSSAPAMQSRPSAQSHAFPFVPPRVVVVDDPEPPSRHRAGHAIIISSLAKAMPITTTAAGRLLGWPQGGTEKARFGQGCKTTISLSRGGLVA